MIIKHGGHKVNLVNYGVFCNGYYTSTRAYPLTFQSSINSTYYAHFYTTSSSSNGFHISSVGDSWETLVGRDIKYYDTDFTGETNGAPGNSVNTAFDTYTRTTSGVTSRTNYNSKLVHRYLATDVNKQYVTQNSAAGGVVLGYTPA